ncbi:polysaccharide deacetylase family protein [Paenibacillus crassostreae]|uniref:Xylanase deacetylase n=1 Tax=Paenibacillus crassostreae TaxID=1763538 RepID=A0A167DJE4_9BACL|nr:polysaccharide deacetylase family protein [Paenibacillus crassostreae]AOZ91394.1 xylanase deacetylase [Paenibacillus crassostreae]OAB74446.1 xylanase deacetylase [Paenibacillus crassostreae]
MKRQTTAFVLACTFLLSSCSNMNTATSDSESNQILKSQELEQSKITQKQTQKKGEELPTLTEESPKDITPEVNKEPKIELNYHMNSNYDIIPNNESISKKVVLLTFDDGPKDADMINGLIDILDKHQAKAIFFVNGYKVKENPHLLKLIHDREQIIGNHSWDHVVLKNKSEAEVKQQVKDVQEIVADITGEKPVYFRAPHGAGGDVTKKVTKDNGMLYMTWSIGSLDWEMKSTDSNPAATIIKNVTEQLHSGSNILMHELPWTVQSLDKLLTELETRGYTFVDPRSIELQMR